MRVRVIRHLAVLTLVVGLGAASTAGASWTTYRGDAARSGIDASSTGQLPFAAAWTSPALAGVMWGQPVVEDGLVIVGTESDRVYALSESTGAIVWQAASGTPVPASQLPCGDISPTVGITSTPVIDSATQRVFVVADTWNGSSVQHQLYAFDLSNGSMVAGYPVVVDPPGSTPADQLQRAALALDGSEIVIGYGGNDGDCGSYHGWLVGVPEAGGAQTTFEVDPSTREGAIWGSGAGPAVDSAGDVWATSGNGGSGAFGYQESVLRLAPNLSLLDWWAPSNWASLDSGDTDLGSAEPLLLPGGLVFQIGKAGDGYLLDAAALGHTGAAPKFEARVCASSYGGAIDYSGVIYVACSDGLRALALNPSGPSFAPLPGWTVSSAIDGPPIESGGLIWATDWKSGRLYGLNPQTGAATVSQATPAMEHFVVPSASDGKLFLATGDTVEAYRVANPLPAPVPVATPKPARCTLRGPRGSRVVPHYARPRRRARRRLAYGTLTLTARCSAGVHGVLTGTISHSRRLAHHRVRVTRIRIRAQRATLRAGRSTIRLRVPPAVVRDLQRRLAESARIALVARSAGGSSRTSLRLRRLRLARAAR